MTKTYLEPSEIEHLEAAATNLRDKLLIRALFHLGCRISEALALTVCNIDSTNYTITINHLKSSVRLLCPKCRTRLSRNAAFCPGCGGKITETVARQWEHRRQRVLPIDKKTSGMLKEYIEHEGPVMRDGKMMIFGINRHRAWQIIKECADRAGLPKLINPETGKTHNVSPHRLRDAFAVHAIKQNDSGDGLRLLQEHLGHQSFNTTARYRKVAGEELKEWYHRLWERDRP